MVPSFFLLAGFCCLRFVYEYQRGLLCSLLNTTPLLHAALLIASVAGIVALCAKIVAAKYAGVDGVIWANGSFPTECCFLSLRSSLPTFGHLASRAVGKAKFDDSMWARFYTRFRRAKFPRSRDPLALVSPSVTRN